MGKVLKTFRLFFRSLVHALLCSLFSGCFDRRIVGCRAVGFVGCSSLVSLVLLVSLVSGCGVKNAGQFKLSQEEVFADYEALDPGVQEIKLNSDDSVHVSSFGYNERNWQPAQLQDFAFPIDWLENGKKLADQIYIVKQVGKSALFCLIKEKAGNENKRSAQYAIFLVRIRADREGVSWGEYLAKEYGANFRNFRELTIGQTDIAHLNWNVEQYWNAPVVVFGQKKVYELTLIYRGFSRSYANQIMNKFPWKVLANN
ncbi:MAG: hypothetical protein AAB766_01875 [Patescibacteria group bacterium]